MAQKRARVSGWFLTAGALCLLASGCYTFADNRATNEAARDGGSMARAVQLKARTHAEGLDAEYAWLQSHFPGWRFAEGGTDANGEETIVFPHRTEADGHGIYSVYVIPLPNGVVREVYFDQTGYLRDQP